MEEPYFKLTYATTYLTIKDELWGVYYEYFEESVLVII